MTPDGDPVYLMGALERLEKGLPLRLVDFHELSSHVDRNEAIRLMGKVRRTRGVAFRGGAELPVELVWLLRKLKARALPAPGEIAGRLVRRVGRREARRIARTVIRSTGSQTRARERSQRRRGRR